VDKPCGTDLNSLALLSTAHTAVSATQTVKLLSIFGPVRVSKLLTDEISTPSLHRLTSIPRGHGCRPSTLQRCTSKTPPGNFFYAIHFRPIWGINLSFSLSRQCSKPASTVADDVIYVDAVKFKSGPHAKAKLTDMDRAKCLADGSWYWCHEPGNVIISCPKKATSAEKASAKASKKTSYAGRKMRQ